MARFRGKVRKGGSSAAWITTRLTDSFAHKHQETMFLRYQGFVTTHICPELVKFTYLEAVKFLENPVWDELPWVLEDDDRIQLPVSKRQEYLRFIGFWLADLLPDKDKEELTKNLKLFVENVDNDWKYRRRKRRV